MTTLYAVRLALFLRYCGVTQINITPFKLQDAAEASILAHERLSDSGERILVVTNFTPVPHEEFRLGVPHEGTYQLLLNTDDNKYHGSGFEVLNSVTSEEVASEGLEQSIHLRLPPLATVFYKLD